MSTYRCWYCRLVHDASAPACPHCGAPIDITARVTDSGWMEQPMIGDMTRLRCGDTRCQIAGTVVPVAEFSLGRNDWIYFAHHVLLWTDGVTTVRPMAADDLPDRRIAGLPVSLLEGRGPGHIGVSDNHAGELIAIPLQPGHRILALPSRFLCATGSVAYDWHRTSVHYRKFRGGETEREYPIGPFHDSFAAHGQKGLLLLHSPGNTFIRDLGADESILVQPSSLVYWEASVELALHLERPRTLGVPSMKDPNSYRIVWLRLRGPGRVAVQSVYELAESTGKLDVFSFGSTQIW
jgi:uncharacterized protein (AIM24 family)